MSNQVVEWTAAAVREAIADAGRSKTSVSDETGIPYPTLNRKTAGKSEFSFSELLLIAEALGVSPTRFTPPPFQRKVTVEAVAA